jgi:hypothetical protein
MPAETDPTRTALTDEQAAVEARRIIADFATSYRDPAPLPAVGSTPPVPQPGRPPMSQRATDASVLMLSGSVLTATLGGSATAILWASGHADPAVVATVFGAPAFLALAISRVLKRAKDAMPEQHHHHYEGPVYQDQRNVHSHTRGVWAKTTNQQ